MRSKLYVCTATEGVVGLLKSPSSFWSAGVACLTDQINYNPETSFHSPEVRVRSCLMAEMRPRHRCRC
jgi:hypothetical protein